MRCRSILLICLMLFSCLVQAKQSSQYEQIAQSCIKLSVQFESLARLQHENYCKSKLTHSDLFMLLTAANLQNHDKDAAINSIIDVLKDFESGGLSLCSHYRQILSAYRKVVQIAQEIKTI